MSEQEQEQQTPVWHAIVGDGWEPVLIGDMTKPEEGVLHAGGWIDNCDAGGYIYGPDMRPRRRRKRLHIPITITSERDGGIFLQRLNAEAGDCFRLADNGELVPFKVEVEE